MYPQQPYAPPRTNGKSVASMVLGIISLVIPFVGIITGPLAVILAVIGKKEIQRTGESGNGLGIAGLVMGIIGCAGYALFVVFLVIAAISASTAGI